MGRLRKLIHKTRLNKVYWGIMLHPPVVYVRRFIRRCLDDYIFNRMLPESYASRSTLPVNPKKVLFVEPRVESLSNSFELLYQELTQNYDFIVHIHLLRQYSLSERAYLQRCKRMLKDAATAKYIFLNDASNVISCIDKRPETVITQLWHACGAFKRFGLSTADYLFGLDAKATRRHPFYRNLDYVTVSSPEVIWAYAEAMDLKGKEDLIVPTGISRTDIFFQEERKQDAYERLRTAFPASRGKKVILFAPTFRGRVHNAQTGTAFDAGVFYRDLKDEYVIVVKHHPYVKELPALPEHLKNRFIYDATKTMSIEDLLFVSDVCISDYSSLIFEYSIFERPMLFFAYDLEEYFDWRGFYYDYDTLTPGPVCRTNEEMTDYILHLDERFDPEQVRIFRNRFMCSCDGHATERIMELVFTKKTLDARRRKRGVSH